MPHLMSQPAGPISFQPRRRNPMSNAERQRLFRERHPGYYARRKAQERALIRAMREARLAAARQPVKVPLMLPAPVETIEIPGMNMIPQSGVAREEAGGRRQEAEVGRRSLAVLIPDSSFLIPGSSGTPSPSSAPASA